MTADSRDRHEESRKPLHGQHLEFREHRRRQRQEMREMITEHKRALRELQRQYSGRGNTGEREKRQQKIIKVALKVLDKEGIDGVSLRKLAQYLDIKAPALYWYFDSKTRLVDFMAEEILRAEFRDLQPPAKDEPWQDWLAAVCKKLRQAMLSHRDGARVVAGAHLYPAVTLMRIFETSMESLTKAGVEGRQAGLIITTAIHFTFGRVIEEQNSPTIAELENLDVSEFMKDYPHMQEARRQIIEDFKNGYDEFDDALRLIIGHVDTR